MSELQKMMENAFIEKERNKDGQAQLDAIEKSKMPITLRLEPLIVFILEHFADQFDCSRAHFGKDILTAAAWDAVEAADLTVDDVQEMYFNSKK